MTWTNGETASKTFAITIIDDNTAETNETVSLVLTNPLGAYLGLQSSAVLTVLEDAYEAWKFAHFGANANNDGIDGELADPDNDRILNLMGTVAGSRFFRLLVHR